ncbi:MAG: SpoIIE family protein phosphatase [Acidobacteria bacterium]|nr:SpoIIE family protein phosphatase [Acidobacteriota bacterium]MCI0723740.1 SpoIIE family protein phosphatase [Acidobacteriota bacterium]
MACSHKCGRDALAGRPRSQGGFVVPKMSNQVLTQFMPDSLTKPTEILRYRRISKDVKTVVLAKILQELQSAPTLQTLLQNVYRMVREEFNCIAVLVSIYDSYREELVYYSPGDPTEPTSYELKLGRGLAGKVGASQSPLRIDNLSDSFPESVSIHQALGVRSRHVMASPLVRRGALLGVIEVFFRESSKKFTDAELLFLTALSYQIAVGLNFFRLSEQAERLSLEEEKLAEVSRRISASLDLDELLDVIIDALRSLVPYDAAGIYLLDKKSQEIQRMVVYGYEISVEQNEILNVGRAAREMVSQQGIAVILHDLQQHPAFLNARSAARSAMAAPILSNNRIIGVFTLESDEQDVYTRSDLALFEKFTQQVALSIEKAQLYRALLDKKRLEQELSIAREIQLSFLPAKPPQLNGFEVAGLNIPSRLVSGDYYDFIRIVDGQWGLVVGDVSGKGIPSSLIMASFRASLLAEIRNNYAIRTIMAKVNQLLWESTDDHQFVTAFYGVLDEKRRILTYCNAGHNPVILIRADGSALRLETGGLILGAFSDSVYWENFVQILPDDLLLLYTDGVTEIYNHAEEEYGVDRLQTLATVNRQRSAKEITQLVKDEILDFAADKTPQDDFTLVVLKALA